MTTLGNLGPYELRGELGRGAMARVWRAWDPRLRREVAIKEPIFGEGISPASRDELGRRFASEGAMAAQLSHPGIVTIYAADVWDGRPAIVMELVEGETLSWRLQRGPLAPQEALAILDQLLDAVGYAHEHGVVHRDIKPDNIFLTQTGRVKLADFGIARSDDAHLTQGTIVGAVLGTPGYMSPEQAVGGPVDARSDLFSVGAVAYEMLTGRNPFGAGEGADTTALLYRTVHEEPPALPPSCVDGLPSDVRPAIMAALAKSPDARPQSAREFSRMLHDQKSLPYASKTVPYDQPPAKAKPSWLPYVAVAGVAAIALGLVLKSAIGGTRGVVETTQETSTEEPAAQVETEEEAGQSQARQADEGQADDNAAEASGVADVTEQRLFPQDEGVNLRAEPRHDSEFVGKAHFDDTLLFFGEVGMGKGSDGKQHDWYHVQVADTDMWGWVRSDLVGGVRPSTGLSGRTEPFWGVWTFASTDDREAIAAAYEAVDGGFADTKVFYTADWDNLNPDPWYVVCLGCENSSDEAESLAQRAIASGYTDAYVKYTGDHR